MQTICGRDSPILDSEGRIVVGVEGWDVTDKVLHVSEKLRMAALKGSSYYHCYRQASCQAPHIYLLDVGDKRCSLTKQTLSPFTRLTASLQHSSRYNRLLYLGRRYQNLGYSGVESPN